MKCPKGRQQTVINGQMCNDLVQAEHSFTVFTSA